VNDTASTSSKATLAPLQPSQATYVLSRSATSRNQKRRRALIINCSIAFLAALSVVSTIAIVLPISTQSRRLAQAVGTATAADSHAAKITNDLNGNGCFQQEFDNKTGRIIQLREPCETVARDNNGVPLPVGTIHRLDAISKAFSGR
jgi:hypothetical protein